MGGKGWNFKMPDINILFYKDSLYCLQNLLHMASCVPLPVLYLYQNQLCNERWFQCFKSGFRTGKERKLVWREDSNFNVVSCIMTHGKSKENSLRQFETLSGAQQRARDYNKHLKSWKMMTSLRERTEIRPHTETRQQRQNLSLAFSFNFCNCGFRWHSNITLLYFHVCQRKHAL